MSNGRITEAALLIANVVEKMKGDGPLPMWIHHDKWTVAINTLKGTVAFTWGEVTARIPFGSIGVWSDVTDTLEGVFSANEGYLNNADEFIADMRELLEKDTV